MEQKLWNKNYLLVFIGIIFIFANFYLLLSCMPLAVKELMNLSTQEMSWIVSIYSLGIVLTRPISGLIADKMGKQKVAAISFLLFSICTAVYLGLSSFYVLIFIRFIHGISHSIGTTAHAAMAVDYSPTHMKGQGIGYYGLAMCLAMVIAPALGLYVVENYSYHMLLIIATVFGFIGTFITAFITKDKVVQPRPKETFSFNNLIESKAVPVGILSLLLSLCYSGIIAFIAVYLKEKNIVNGPMYFYIAFAISMVISRPFIGKIIDKKGAGFLIYPSLALLSIGMMCMGISNSLLLVIITGLILGLSYGCVFPCFQTIAVQSCPAEKSGSAMGTFFLFYDCGFGLGAIVLAKVSIYSGYSNMYFIISSIILIMMVIYGVFKKMNLFKS